MSNFEKINFLSKKRKKSIRDNFFLFRKKLLLKKNFSKKKNLSSSLEIDLNKASVYTLKSIKLGNFVSSCLTNSTSENESVEKNIVSNKKYKENFTIPQFINFKKSDNNEISFRCIDDKLVLKNLKIDKKVEDNIWMKLDNDEISEEEDLKSGQNKLHKFLSIEINKIKNNKMYLNNKLFRKKQKKKKKKKFYIIK